MKLYRFFQLLCLTLFGSHGQDAFSATYYARASGNWNVPATWSQVTYGGAASATYPGQLGAGDVVLISGYVVTLTTTPPNALASIALNHLGPVAPTRLILNTAGTLLTTGALTMIDNNVDQHIELEVSSTAVLQVNGNILVTRSTINNRNKRVRVYVHGSGRINSTGNFTYAYNRSGGENELEVLLDNSGRIDVGGNFNCTIGQNLGGGDLFTLQMNGTSQLNVNGTSSMIVQNSTDGDDLQLDLNGGTFNSSGAMVVGVAATCTGGSVCDVLVDGAALNANNGMTFTQAAGAHSNLLLNNASALAPASLYVGGDLIITHNQAAQNLTLQINANSSFSVEGNMAMSADDNNGEFIYLDQNGGSFYVAGDLTGVISGPGNAQGINWAIDGTSTALVGNDVLFSQLSGGPLQIFLNKNSGSNAGLTVGNDLVVAHSAGSGRFELDMYNLSDVTIGRDMTFTAAFGANNEFAFIGMRNGNNFTVGRDLLMTMTAGTNGANDLTLREWSGTASIGRNVVFTKGAGDEAYWNQDGGTATIGGDLHFVSTGGDDCWFYLDNASTMNVTGNVTMDMSGGDQARIWLNENNGSTAQLTVGGNMTINKAASAGEVQFLQSQSSQVHITGDLNWNHIAGDDLSRYRINNSLNSMTIGGSFNCRLLAGPGVSDIFRLDCNGGDIAVGQNVLWQHDDGDDMIAILNNAMLFDVNGDLTLTHSGGDDMLLDMNNNTTLLYVHGNVLMNDAAAGTTTTIWRMDGATQARVLGNLTMTATAGGQVLLDMNNTSYLWVKGSIVRNAAPNHFGSISCVSGSIIEFNGTANTQIMTDDSGDGGDYVHYERVIINNTFTAYPQVLTEGTTTIWNNILFQNGVLGTAATRKLVVEDGSTSNGGTLTSFVDGPMKKIGNDDHTFPVGDNGFWARLAMVNIDAANDDTEFDCEYLASPSPNNLPPFYGPGIDHVSFVEHWIHQRVLDAGNDANCQVRLYWENAARSVITSNADLRVAGYRTSNNKWNNHGGTGAGGASGSILGTAVFNEFNMVTFASAAGINPLPIELLDFTAYPMGDEVGLQWRTASEHDNSHFEVERSADGINFIQITRVDGAGTSLGTLSYSAIDPGPLTGLSYYRLKQVDLDGRFEYSGAVSVMFTGENHNGPIIFPNPGTDMLTIAVDRVEDGAVLFELLDMSGRKVMSERTTSPSQQVVVLNTAALPAGPYIVRTSADGRMPSTARWVKGGH